MGMKPRPKTEEPFVLCWHDVAYGWIERSEDSIDKIFEAARFDKEEYGASSMVFEREDAPDSINPRKVRVTMTVTVQEVGEDVDG